MTDFLATLGTLTLGGSAAVGLLALISRSARSRYSARWRCLAWLLLCLRLAVPVPLLPQGSEQIHSPVRLPAPSDTVIYHRPAPPEEHAAYGRTILDAADRLRHQEA